MNFRAIRNALYSVLTLSSIAIVASSGAYAASISCGENSNVQLTGIALSSATTPNPNPNLLAGTPDRVYNSYACTGFQGNDQPLPSGNNIGLRNDGFMNMDAATINALSANTDGPANNDQSLGYDYGLFIDESDLQAIGDPNVAEDPGWIYLGKQEGPSFGYSSVLGENLGQFLSIDFSSVGQTSGTWSVGVDFGAIPDIESFLGRASFDHLAIILKAGNYFGIYDFNFNDIFVSEFVAGNVLDFRTEYTFSGTWQTNDLRNNGGQIAGLSHATVWARDPLPPEEVSAPGVLGLLGLSLFGIAVRRRNRK